MPVQKWYPTGAVSSGFVQTKNAEDSKALASLRAYDNSEFEISYVTPDGESTSKIMGSLLSLGKQLNGGKFNDVHLAEMTTNNYPEFKFGEKSAMNRIFEVKTKVNNGTDTTIELKSALGLQRGDMLRVPKSSEIMRISAVNNDTLTVVRGTSSDNNWQWEAIEVGDKLVFIGSAIENGSAGRKAFSVEMVERTNYIQKFITTVRITDGDVFANKYGQNKSVAIKALLAEKLYEHMKSLEYTALFGQKKKGTDPETGEAWYTTEWLFNTALRGHIGDISSGFTVSTFTKAIGKTLLYGSNTKVVFCGTNALGKIQELFHSQIRTQTIKDVNLEFETLSITGGKFVFVQHPNMDEANNLEDYIVVCDVKEFRPVFPTGTTLQGKSKSGKTTFHILENLSHHSQEVGEYVTYMGFKNTNVLSAGVFKIA